LKGRPEVDAYVYAVQYDRKSAFPVLTIHAVLMLSDDLGMNYGGKLN
jgi:hypothetical protein